jgi:hypothetical protein
MLIVKDERMDKKVKFSLEISFLQSIFAEVNVKQHIDDGTRTQISGGSTEL